MDAPKYTVSLFDECPSSCTNRCAEKTALKAGYEVANAEYVDYLKQMIKSLLDNQVNLSAALDETREACAQLNLQKSELEASNTQEVQVLQAELSMCRQGEAEITLAYEDLRSRVEAIDSIIGQIPWLDVLFNSDEPLPSRLKALKFEPEEADTNPQLSQTSSTLHSVSYDENDGDIDEDEEEDIDAVRSEIIPPNHHGVPLSAWRRASQPVRRTGSASPLSDSGCTSESHDEISLTSLNSVHSSPHLAILRGRLEAQQQQHQIQTQNGVRMRRAPKDAPIKRSATSFGSGWKLGKITESLRMSISKFADKSEWKMEALAAKQREARALVLLNETQAEVRKIESRCKGLTRRQNEQELRMSEKEKEIERLMDQERELRRELRNWQQRVFQLEAETQEIRHTYQIADLDMKSRLLEASIQAADPTARVKPDVQNPISLFSEDLLRLKINRDESDNIVTTPSTPKISVSVRSTLDELHLPPKFTKPSLRGRPRFASTINLSRFPSASPSQQINTTELNRPASSLNLNRSNSGSESSSFRNRADFLTTSFGSLSELELKAEV
ncbi:unnamed protein product [Hymenolepis diminuta]|uniref:Uncharacterized protein n=2 Tax=Hymenolepis diminuta TaxID=6216 RepID=A0A564YXK8_HYMDI|nr:unnamed protein product [Hymenolepis diminuta]